MEKLKFYKNLDLADIVYFDEELGEFLTEQWKDIIGYENYYQASNIGRVKSLERYVKGAHNNKRLLKSRIKVLQFRKVGYLIIKFCKDGIETSNSVHRLVAEAFIPNPENKPEVNHKKGIKWDNRAWMLEWVTPKENIEHGYANGLIQNIGEKHGKAKLKESDVLEIRKSTLSKKELSKIYNVTISCIHGILNRTYWGHI